METPATAEQFENYMENLSATTDLMRSNLSDKIAVLEETERKVRSRQSELLTNIRDEAPGAEAEYSRLERQMDVTVVAISNLKAARESLARISDI